MENIGLTFTLSLPPHAFTFGVFPLHWRYLKHGTSIVCVDCGAETKTIQLRFGPLFFAVVNAGHEHT